MAEIAGQHLERGATVSRYEILEVLGAGGFGITYKVFDTRLHCEAAMKEYLPAEFAARGNDSKTVMPRSETVAGEFRHGLKRFLDEARVLAKFKNRHIVRVSDYMEENGTAYLIMDYEEGQSLRAMLNQRGGSLSETEIKDIFIPILDGLKAVHEAGLLHRDIKPDNIYLRKNGPPVLLDFGAARQYTASQTRSVTATVTPGFAPFEQYQPNGELGAWTDIYGLGATLYACVSGKPPVDAITRQAHPRVDPLPPAVDVGAERYSEGLLRTIDWMLRPVIGDRPQSVDEVLPCIQGRAEPPETVTAEPDTAPTVRVSAGEGMPDSPTVMRTATRAVPPRQAQPQQARAAGRRTGLIAGIATLVILTAGGGWWYLQEQEAQRLAVEQQQEQARQQRLAELRETLGQAERALDAGRYTAPAGDNALALFNRALESDPQNERARAGLDKLFAALLSRADQAAAIADFEGAGQHLADAGRIYPDNPELAGARQRVAEEQAQLQAEIEARREQERAAEAETSQAAAAEPVPAETETTQAEATQAEATQAEATQAEATQAEATQAETTQAEATQAEATQAEATQAEATQAETTQAAAAEPATAETQPAAAGGVAEPPAPAAEPAPAAAESEVETQAAPEVAAGQAGGETSAADGAPAPETPASEEPAQTARLEAPVSVEPEPEAVAGGDTNDITASDAPAEAPAASMAEPKAPAPLPTDTAESVVIPEKSAQPDARESFGDDPEAAAAPSETADAPAMAAAEPAAAGSAAPADDGKKVTENVDEFLTALMLESSQAEAGGQPAEPAAQDPASAEVSGSRIEEMLIQAQTYLAASNLVAPEGRNARSLYRRVLAVDADNLAARAGLNRIGSVYEKAAVTMLNEGRPGIGRLIIERGLEAVPDHPGLLSLRSRLASQ